LKENPTQIPKSWIGNGFRNSLLRILLAEGIMTLLIITIDEFDCLVAGWAMILKVSEKNGRKKKAFSSLKLFPRNKF